MSDPDLPVSDAAFALGTAMARSFFAKREDAPEVLMTEVDLAAGLAIAADQHAQATAKQLVEALNDARQRFANLAFDIYTTNTDSAFSRERFKIDAQLGRDAVTAALKAAGVQS